MGQEYFDEECCNEEYNNKGENLYKCIIKIINNTIKDIDTNTNEISVNQKVNEIDELIKCITYPSDRKDLNDAYSVMQHKIYNKFYKSIIDKFLEDGNTEKLDKNAITLYFDTKCHKGFLELVINNIVNFSDEDDEEVKIYNYYKMNLGTDSLKVEI